MRLAFLVLFVALTNPVSAFGDFAQYENAKALFQKADHLDLGLLSPDTEKALAGFCIGHPDYEFAEAQICLRAIENDPVFDEGVRLKLFVRSLGSCAGAGNGTPLILTRQPNGDIEISETKNTWGNTLRYSKAHGSFFYRAGPQICHFKLTP